MLNNLFGWLVVNGVYLLVALLLLVGVISVVSCVAELVASL